MMEPRCLVCGNPLSKSAWFGYQDCGKDSKEKQQGAENEVCSDECLEVYTSGGDRQDG